MTLKMLLICLPLAAGLGCGDNNGAAGKDAGTHVDSSVPTDGSGSGSGSNIIPPDASCFDLSTITAPTNNQIINACTDSDKIFKDSHPPLQGSDGSLPPLP